MSDVKTYSHFFAVRHVESYSGRDTIEYRIKLRYKPGLSGVFGLLLRSTNGSGFYEIIPYEDKRVTIPKKNILGALNWLDINWNVLGFKQWWVPNELQ